LLIQTGIVGDQINYNGQIKDSSESGLSRLDMVLTGFMGNLMTSPGYQGKSYNFDMIGMDNFQNFQKIALNC